MLRTRVLGSRSGRGVGLALLVPSVGRIGRMARRSGALLAGAVVRAGVRCRTHVRWCFRWGRAIDRSLFGLIVKFAE